MLPGYHDHEKFVQTHRQELLNEAEHERLLSQIAQPDHNVLRNIRARLALLLQSLRARRQERVKHHKRIHTSLPS